MKQLHIHFIGMIVAILVGVSISVVFIWGRMAPLHVVKSDVTPSVSYPGGIINVHREVQWNRADCNGIRISAVMIDSNDNAHFFVDKPLGLPMREYRTTDRQWTVPNGIAGGDAIYVARISLDCFPFYSWWPIELTLPEIKFRIE